MLIQAVFLRKNQPIICFPGTKLHLREEKGLFSQQVIKL